MPQTNAEKATQVTNSGPFTDRWHHPRDLFLPDELLQRMQDAVDHAGGLDESVRLSRIWDHSALDSASLREIIFFPRLSVPGQRAPTVSEQIVVALNILNSGPTAHDTEEVSGVIVQAQRVLSAHLVRFPVLMHPLMRLPVHHDGFYLKLHGANLPIISLGQAIVATHYGRFPLAEDNLDSEAIDRFYRHPVTRLGLFSQPNGAAPVDEGGRDMESESPLDALMEESRPLTPQVLASMYQAYTSIGALDPDGARLSQAFKIASNQTGRLAETFERSCKMRFGTDYAPAVEALRQIGVAANEVFTRLVADSMLDLMFRTRTRELSEDEYVARVTDVVRKVSMVGLGRDVRGACEFLQREVQRKLKDGSLGEALPWQVVAFLQVLVDEGQTQLKPESFVAPQWAAASAAVSNASAMRESINSVLSAANDASHSRAKRVGRMGL